MIKTCLFSISLFRADHFSAFILFFRELLRSIFIHFESFYFCSFVKLFRKYKWNLLCIYFDFIVIILKCVKFSCFDLFKLILTS